MRATKLLFPFRGVGNETNQNAIAAPSVAFHMDGIFIASPFALQTDFIDVDRIEVLEDLKGTLFGQNSTGGVINVISKKPSMEEYLGKSDITFGNYGFTKFRSSNNFCAQQFYCSKAFFSHQQKEMDLADKSLLDKT